MGAAEGMPSLAQLRYQRPALLHGQGSPPLDGPPACDYFEDTLLLGWILAHVTGEKGINNLPDPILPDLLSQNYWNGTDSIRSSPEILYGEPDLFKEWDKRREDCSLARGQVQWNGDDQLLVLGLSFPRIQDLFVQYPLVRRVLIDQDEVFATPRAGEDVGIVKSPEDFEIRDR